MKTWSLQPDLLAPVPTDPQSQGRCFAGFAWGQDWMMDWRLYCPLRSPVGSFKRWVMITRSPKARRSFPEGLSLWQKPPCCPEADAVSRADVFT